MQLKMRREKIQFLSTFCSVLALSRLDDLNPHAGGPSLLLKY